MPLLSYHPVPDAKFNYHALFRTAAISFRLGVHQIIEFRSPVIDNYLLIICYNTGRNTQTIVYILWSSIDFDSIADTHPPLLRT